jgi:hypothetical protein
LLVRLQQAPVLPFWDELGNTTLVINFNHQPVLPFSDEPAAPPRAPHPNSLRNLRRGSSGRSTPRREGSVATTPHDRTV